MKIAKLNFFCLILILFSFLYINQSPCFANDLSGIQLGGFLSGGYSQSDNPYSARIGLFDGDKPNYSQDTQAGFNLSKTYENTWDFYLQFLVKDNGSHDTQLDLDIAQGSFFALPYVKISLGRLRSATWLVSPYLNVGYAYPWIRPPVEVYGLQPFQSFNGARFSLKNNWGAGQLDFEMSTGSITQKPNSESDRTFYFSAEDIVSVGLRYTYENFLFNAVYVQGDVRGTIEIIDTITSPPIALRVRSNIDFGKTEFHSMGAKFANSEWLSMLEYAYEKSEITLLKEVSSYYATLGRYIDSGRFLLHITRSEILDSKSAEISNDSWIIEGEQISHILGFNYYPASSLALKAEVQNIKTQRGRGFLQKDPHGDVTVWGLNASFVF